MKTILSFWLALLMMLSFIPALAEETVETPVVPETETAEPLVIDYDYDHVTVGSTTPLQGNFMSKVWGSNGSDLEIRMLLHGYNLVDWDNSVNGFILDPSVVSGTVVTDDAEGNRTYTLALYNDLYYSDGTAITARDYAFTMLLGIAPEMAAIGARTLPVEYILGYQDYMNGTVPYLAGIRVISDTMLAITVSHEYLPFFYELGLLDCTPTPIAVLAPGARVMDDGLGVYIANEDPQRPAVFSAETLRSTILDSEHGYLSHPSVSSGAYQLVSYDGNTVEMEINPYYKGNFRGEKPSVRYLTYKTVSAEAMPELLTSGEVTLLNKCTSASTIQATMEAAADYEQLTYTNYPRNGVAFLAFCCERPTVSSLAVRQAIAHCIDKPAILAATVSNYGIQVDGYYGLGQWMYQIMTGATAYPVEEPAANASAQEIAAYEEEIAAWEALNMDGIPVYDLNVEEAVRLLEADGWTLNREGNAFDPQKDDVRCKQVNGALTALDLKLVYPEENKVFSAAESVMTGPLAQAGIRLTMTAVPMNELLRSYYRMQDRDCDMLFMASNYDVVFDPSLNVKPDGNGINAYNFSAVNDPALYQSALRMRNTPAGDLLGYVTNWIAFQTEFQRALPAIGLYSNVYFDFYPQNLQNYDAAGNIGWSKAMVSAIMGDIPEPVETELEDGTEIEIPD